jgi:hypothetical protein
VEECIQEVRFTQSKFDMTLVMTAGFWQMMLAKFARPFMAFTVPAEEQFQWRMSLVGLMGFPMYFSRLMDMAIRGLQNVLTYIDDILIHSDTLDSHLQNVEQPSNVCNSTT